MRSVAFHPEAEAEFIAAAQYYEGETENLGLDLISAVERTYQRLTTFPESGHSFGPKLRRVLVPGFPYGLLYRAEPDRIFLLPSLTCAGGRAIGGIEHEWRAAQQGLAADTSQPGVAGPW